MPKSQNVPESLQREHSHFGECFTANMPRCLYLIILYMCYHRNIWSIPTKVMHIGKKTTLLHSPEFFSLYRRHMELSQKIYASSYYMIVAT